jgi:hypothetical protein
MPAGVIASNEFLHVLLLYNFLLAVRMLVVLSPFDLSLNSL